MVYGAIGGSTAAATAAAAKKRRDQEEEEHMTNYTPQDLQDDWEFKIVRSTLEAFRNPTTLHQLIEEEARAGWIMVEKFDNGRVRFKRPASARANDRTLSPDVDPYRTTFGSSEITIVFVVLGLIVLLTLGLVLATIIMI